MVSTSNSSVEDRVLQAAESCVRHFGVERVTVAEIARRAGVSRPTVYRRWPEARSILTALLTSRITGALRDVPALGHDRKAVVDRVVAVARRLSDDAVVMALLRSELAMVYITERLGTSQQMLLGALAEQLKTAQRDGSVRPGDPRRLAAMVLLITQSAIQSSRPVAPVLDAETLAAELTHALNGYLS